MWESAKGRMACGQPTADDRRPCGCLRTLARQLYALECPLEDKIGCPQLSNVPSDPLKTFLSRKAWERNYQLSNFAFYASLRVAGQPEAKQRQFPFEN
uniref:Uncharacterized protein n=1 Tax=Tupiella akineta TaxID=160070 RepID=Q6UVU6_TUPAK|nr:hypothetical protein PsakpMp16 [Tupiella akineta]AAQ18728.1 hypothetical protein [Tupiella akineta]